MIDRVLLLCESVSLTTALRIAARAVALGYKIVLAAPASAKARPVPPGVVLLPMPNWSTAELRRACELAAGLGTLVGIGTPLGFFSVDGLLSSQIAELAAARGLPHGNAQALMLANNKFLMRQTLERFGIYTVRHYLVNEEDDLAAAASHVGFPLIMKPMVGLGSSFVSRCETLAQMLDVFRHYRENVESGYYSKIFCGHEAVLSDGSTRVFDPKRQILVEEAIDGIELSVECICTERDVITALIHEKLDVTQEAYCAYENLLVIPPVRLDAAAQQKILEYTQSMLYALDLRNCFCHVEMRFDSRDRPSVIEINPRIGGMRVVDSLRTLANIDFTDVFIKLMVGESIAGPQLKSRDDKIYGMMALYPRQGGILRGVTGLEEAKGIAGMLDISGDYFPIGSRIGGDFEEVFVVDAWFSGRNLADIQAIDGAVRQLVRVHIDS